jgi:hypothetical protein
LSQAALLREFMLVWCIAVCSIFKNSPLTSTQSFMTDSMLDQERISNKKLWDNSLENICL